MNKSDIEKLRMAIAEAKESLGDERNFELRVVSLGTLSALTSASTSFMDMLQFVLRQRAPEEEEPIGLYNACKKEGGGA